VRVELAQKAHLAGVDVVMEIPVVGKRHGYQRIRAIQLQPPHPGRMPIADDKTVVRENGGDTALAAHAYPTNRAIGVDDHGSAEIGLQSEEIKAQFTAGFAPLDEHRMVVDAIRVGVCGGCHSAVDGLHGAVVKSQVDRNRVRESGVKTEHG